MQDLVEMHAHIRLECTKSVLISLVCLTDGVMSLEWSTSSEWVLVTGGCDGAIRFWDIRRAGCFRVLDQSHTQFGRRPPLLVCPTTTNKVIHLVIN